jgi:DNA primase
MTVRMVPFAQVKRAVGIEAVLSRYGLLSTLELRGANLTGHCPFCEGSSKRRFRASPEKNAWYCFGCKRGGNVLDFVAEREGMTLRAAAVALNDWFSLGLGSPDAPAKPAPEPAVAAAPAADAVLELGANLPLTFALKTLDAAHLSVAGLGLSPITVNQFGLGYCNKGLLKGRIAVPIRNSKGELLAYAGLSPDLASDGRYLFPPKFHPALEVFNLDRLPATREPDTPIYLASEILDVLRLVDAGVEPVLGLFDGSLSEPQTRLLDELLAPGSRLTLSGASFDPRAVARLTDRFLVRTMSLGALMPEPAAAPAN